jgi:hypothetical protein
VIGDVVGGESANSTGSIHLASEVVGVAPCTLGIEGAGRQAIDEARHRRDLRRLKWDRAPFVAPVFGCGLRASWHLGAQKAREGQSQAGLFGRFEHARLAAKALRAVFGDRLDDADFPDDAERIRTRAVLADWIGERAA